MASDDFNNTNKYTMCLMNIGNERTVPEKLLIESEAMAGGGSPPVEQDVSLKLGQHYKILLDYKKEFESLMSSGSKQNSHATVHLKIFQHLHNLYLLRKKMEAAETSAMPEINGANEDQIWDELLLAAEAKNLEARAENVPSQHSENIMDFKAKIEILEEKKVVSSNPNKRVKIMEDFEYIETSEMPALMSVSEIQWPGPCPNKLNITDHYNLSKPICVEPQPKNLDKDYRHSGNRWSYTSQTLRSSNDMAEDDQQSNIPKENTIKEPSAMDWCHFLSKPLWSDKCYSKASSSSNVKAEDKQQTTNVPKENTKKKAETESEKAGSSKEKHEEHKSSSDDDHIDWKSLIEKERKRLGLTHLYYDSNSKKIIACSNKCCSNASSSSNAKAGEKQKTNIPKENTTKEPLANAKAGEKQKTNMPKENTEKKAQTESEKAGSSKEEEEEDKSFSDFFLEFFGDSYSYKKMLSEFKTTVSGYDSDPQIDYPRSANRWSKASSSSNVKAKDKQQTNVPKENTKRKPSAKVKAAKKQQTKIPKQNTKKKAKTETNDLACALFAPRIEDVFTDVSLD